MRRQIVSSVLLLGTAMVVACGGSSSTTIDDGHNSGMIAITCRFTERAEVDPIRAGDMTATPHLHDFFGPTRIDNTTDAVALLQQENSCLSNGDRSAYWVPTMFVDGQHRDPIDAAVYVTASSQDSMITAPPNGLEMMSFRSAWRCVSNGLTNAHLSHCPPNAQTRLVLEFPHCWDGESLQFRIDSPHLVGSSEHCPSSHPVVLPQISVEVRYDLSDVDDLRVVRFSSGDLTTVHGDVLFAWDQEVLRKEIDSCVSRGVVCGITWSTDVGA